jgi:anti-anti-sigma factor
VTPARPGGPRRADVTWSQEGGDCVLSIQGRLITGELGHLSEQIDRLSCTACRTVVVDLGELEAIDDAGLAMIVGLSHYVGARGGRFSLRAVPPDLAAQVQRPLGDNPALSAPSSALVPGGA